MEKESFVALIANTILTNNNIRLTRICNAFKSDCVPDIGKYSSEDKAYDIDLTGTRRNNFAINVFKKAVFRHWACKYHN